MIFNVDYLKVYYYDYDCDAKLYLIFDSNTCFKDFIKWLVYKSSSVSIHLIILKNSFRNDEEIFMDIGYSLDEFKSYILDIVPEEVL